MKMGIYYEMFVFYHFGLLLEFERYFDSSVAFHLDLFIRETNQEISERLKVVWI